MKTGSRLRTGGIWILVLMLAVAMTATTDSALAWGKKKPDKEAPRKAVNLHKHPNMTFKRGVLNKDIYGNWELNQTTLVFDRHSRVTKKSDSFGQVVMSEGHEALVMGYERGGVFVVHRVTMIDVDKSIARGAFNAGRNGGEPNEMSSSTPQ